jgi:hypothetical protein
MKFLVIYYSTLSAADQMANATPEQAKAGMDAWMAWAGRTGPALVEMGAPLGAGQRIAPGSVTASDSKVSGYSILQAESADAVVKLLEGHPHLHTPGGSWIEALEFIPMPGMPA